MPSPSSYAVVCHPSVGPVRLEPGDLVGRLRSAVLRIDHPHISEAHAYLSVRDGALKLLALRGGLALAGRVVREVTLVTGQEVTLARDQALTVEQVHHPEHLLALKSAHRPREVLTGRALSLVAHEGLVGRIVPDAAVHLWTDGSGWVARSGGEPARPLSPGDVLEVGEEHYEVVEVRAERGATPSTGLAGRLDPPLRIEGYFDAVHVHREGHAPVVLSGAAGRLLYELGAIAQPVHWTEMGRTLWPAEDDPERLRKKWDITLVRLRQRLARDAIRTTLVHPDGTGHVQLLLQPCDQYIDRG